MTDLITIAEQLANNLEQLKELEKIVDNQKEILKKELTDGTHIIGSTVVNINTQMKESLNKDKLIKKFGIEQISRFTKICEYRVLTCKKTAKAA